jgi:hypothetical protein
MSSLGVSGVEETVTVTAEASLIDKNSATIATGLSDELIHGLPVGQDYRDLQKLIPGVQYTQELTRGPSAGGSGQDNVYSFDGVNVTVPLFGTCPRSPRRTTSPRSRSSEAGPRPSTSTAPAASPWTR